MTPLVGVGLEFAAYHGSSSAEALASDFGSPTPVERICFPGDHPSAISERGNRRNAMARVAAVNEKFGANRSSCFAIALAVNTCAAILAM